MLALPERGGIAGRLGFFFSLFDHLDEMTEELLVLTASPALSVAKLALEPHPVPSPQCPSHEVVPDRFEADWRQHSRSGAFPLRTAAIPCDVHDERGRSGALDCLYRRLELLGHPAVAPDTDLFLTGLVAFLRGIDLQALDGRLTERWEAARGEDRNLDD